MARAKYLVHKLYVCQVGRYLAQIIIALRYCVMQNYSYRQTTKCTYESSSSPIAMLLGCDVAWRVLDAVFNTLHISAIL